MGGEDEEEDGVAVDLDVGDQVFVEAVWTANLSEVGCETLSCFFRLMVACPAQGVRVCCVAILLDHVHHGGVPLEARAAENAAWRQEASEPEE